METLEEAYRIATGNGGAPGIDGQEFEDIEATGVAPFLAELREELLRGHYQPQPNCRVAIPKGNGKVRTLSISILVSYCTSVQAGLGLIEKGQRH
jgi:retron-type reverse transcriptase